MSREINITFLSYIVWFCFYGLFAKQDSSTWTLLYYVVEPCFVALFAYFLGKKMHVLKWVVNIVIGVQLLRIIYNILFFVSPEIGRFVNGSKMFLSLVCSIIVMCLIIQKKKI